MVRSPHRATAALLVSVGAVVSFTNLACTRETSKDSATAKPPPTPALLDMGRQLYEKQCASCHGPRGAGDGPAAYLLYPKPRDFTQGEFRLVSTSTMQATDEDLFLTITRGMPGSSMPSWETFTPEQRWALVYYVRHLTGASDPMDPASIIPPPAAGPTGRSAVADPPSADAAGGGIIHVPPETPTTPEGVARGRAIFAQACASCHGPLGRGDGQQVMTDNAGFPIKPRDLTAGIFKGSSESRDLYYRIIAGLPGSPMPSYAGVYTDEQLWDLIHYVQSLVPPGVEDRVRLRAKTIRARRIRGEVPSELTASAWRAAQPVFLALTPLWWRDQRVEGVEVKALHNGKELALHLSWSDPTRDSATVAPQDFSDGAAVEFSVEQDPPFFGMGDASGAVHIWFWKASWQEDLAGWRDVERAYPNAAVDWYPAHDPEFMGGWAAGNPLSDPNRQSAAEEAMAKGLGTLTSREPSMQRIQAKGLWQDGRWQVVLHRPLASNEPGDLKVQPGQKVSVAFAVWDGHAGDRNGQKSVSVWHTLILER